MAAEGDRAISYQAQLRALGAYLDQESVGRFRVIEIPNGFTLVMEEGGGKPDLREVHLTYQTLGDQARQLAQGRKLLGSKYQTGWSLCPTGHQDFLRALGYELDDSQASNILLDELEDAVLVTYSYLDPARGFQWHKQLVVLRREQIESMVDSARGRRARRRLLGR